MILKKILWTKTYIGKRDHEKNKIDLIKKRERIAPAESRSVLFGSLDRQASPDRYIKRTCFVSWPLTETPASLLSQSLNSGHRDK